MMKKAVMQFTACCLAVGIAASSFGMAALADNTGMTLAGLSEKNIIIVNTTLAGLSETDSVMVVERTADTKAEDGTSEEAEETAAETAETGDASDAAETSADEAKAAAAAETAEETEAAETETETEPVYDTSMSGETAFGQCDNYINVRSEASADSEVVGKIYNNNSVTILGQLGDWYEIQSGNVTGYVNAAYIATGEEADTIAEETAYNVATVNAEGLWVHSEASEDSDTIAMVYYSDQMEVVAYEGDWMKVVLEDGTYGYVNAWYVDYDSYYSTGETLEEEQERLDEQWLEYLAEQEAAAAAEAAAAEAAAAEAAAAAETEAAATTTTTTETTTSSSTSLDEATAAVDAAYQAYLEAQEAADAATHQADEQLVYDTYDAAVAAYQEYLNAVNAKNEIKYGSSSSETTTSTSETTATTTETTTTEAATTETATTEAATETAATEAAQTEAAQTETAATEAATEAATTTTTTSSSSSTGQSIANYAVQFVGNPYVYGGTSLTNGADCSGFTQSVFAHFGISISRTAASQASGGTAVSLSDIQAGDLLFYSNGGSISHVALYIGNGQIVHASTSSTGIIISSYNYRTPVCARRYWS